MKGHSILKSLIGKTILEGKIQSFYLNGELVDKANIVFLKFDYWIKVTTGEEVTDIDKKNPEPIDLFNIDESNKFEYPLVNIENEYPDFKSVIGLKLIEFKELVWTKNNEVSCGLKLYFENDRLITIYSDENNNTHLFLKEKELNEIEEK